MPEKQKQLSFNRVFSVLSWEERIIMAFSANYKRSCWYFLPILLCCVIVFSAGSAQSSEAEEVLAIGVRADAPPFSFCDGENVSSCQGYSVSLCELIAGRAVKEGIACRYELKMVTGLDRFKALRDGNIDMLCGASTVTLERMRVADFSLFTFLSGISVMYDKSVAEKENGKNSSISIGMLQGTTSEDRIDQIWEKLRSELGAEERDFTTVDIQNHYQGLDALRSGKISAYVADREILLALQKKSIKESPGLRVAKDYYSIEQYAIGVSLGNRDLLFVTNTVLSELFDQKMTDNGEMGIFTVLKEHFPGSKFSKSLKDMFETQRLEVGSRILGPLQKISCSDDHQSL